MRCKVGRNVSSSEGKGSGEKRPCEPPRPGQHGLPSRIGPDGFYGSSSWAGEIDWELLSARPLRPLVGRRRRADAPGHVVVSSPQIGCDGEKVP